MEEELRYESIGNNNILAIDAVVVSEESVELDNQQDVASEEVNLQQTTTYSIEQPKFGWNFGAFTFPLIWALCNGCLWQAMIMFIPGINQIWRFFLGGFGNRWAWNVYGEDMIVKFNKQADVERFNKIQKGWNIAGIIALSIIAVIVIVSIALG